MKLLKQVSLSIIVFFYAANSQMSAQIREFYQLKIYTFETKDQEKSVDAYLEKALLPALNRQRIENVGVFKNRKDSEADSIHKTYVLIPFISLFQFQTLDDLLALDEGYLEAGKVYINSAYDDPPYQRFESILLKAFDDMPMLSPTSMDGPRSERIYELRSYESATEKIFDNKMEMFNRGGEINLFKDLAFNPVFFGEVIAGPKMPNLMYMTAHKNQTERDLNWKKFIDSKGWKTMSSLDQYQNNVSHIDIYFLYSTSYSTF